jgi:hypothetical protein
MFRKNLQILNSFPVRKRKSQGKFLLCEFFVPYRRSVKCVYPGYRAPAWATVCVQGVGNPSRALPHLGEKSGSRNPGAMEETCAKSVSYSFGTWHYKSQTVNRVRTLHFTRIHLIVTFKRHCSFLKCSLCTTLLSAWTELLYFFQENKSLWCSTTCIDTLSTFQGSLFILNIYVLFYVTRISYLSTRTVNLNQDMHFSAGTFVHIGFISLLINAQSHIVYLLICIFHS